MNPKKTMLKICTGHSCSSRHSKYIVERAVAANNKANALLIETCGCQGNCNKGPTVIEINTNIQTKHSNMSPTKIAKLIKNKS